MILGDTEAIWKSELLNSVKLEDLFFYNFRNEFDWNTTLKFISNRNNFSFWQCNQNNPWNTKDRSYRIKNLIKEIANVRTNDIEVNVLIKNSVYDYELKLLEEKKNEEAEIVRDINFEFIRILKQPSKILLGKNREWELLRVIECYCYEQIRSKIWKTRCDFVYEIEKDRGLTKKDLKKRKGQSKEEFLGGDLAEEKNKKNK
ncbi:hypothetical protein RhiirA5_437941 [Rhizophagus irregularis]|uniref:Uncharacterized protein n=1 Tax=Rhizophagus irregularis TaxID=588596 RepID=A0A2N0NJT5_9GLOM|nr:hypothetical protein RhiirA5_437941 [Rhizophagus irregularis]